MKSSIQWIKTPEAKRVESLLRRGFSYRTVMNRCGVGKHRIITLVKHKGVGVRRYRDARTDYARKVMLEIDMALHTVKRIMNQNVR